MRRSGAAALAPGTTSDTEVISPSIASNGNVRVTYSGSQFSGPQSLAENTRQVMGSAGTNGMTRAAGWGPTWTDSSVVAAFPYIYSGTAPLTNGAFDLSLKVVIPAGTGPGSYSGSIVLTFSNV